MKRVSVMQFLSDVGGGDVGGGGGGRGGRGGRGGMGGDRGGYQTGRGGTAVTMNDYRPDSRISDVRFAALNKHLKGTKCLLAGNLIV